MKTGQVVRLKPASHTGPRAAIPPGTTGTVLCAYRLLQRFPRHPERVDVDFKAFGVLWGEASELFEPRAQDDSH